MNTISTAIGPPIQASKPTNSPLSRLADALYAWAERSRQRASLMELDERMLRDIGLSRSDVAREIDKPFWRV